MKYYSKSVFTDINKKKYYNLIKKVKIIKWYLTKHILNIYLIFNFNELKLKLYKKKK